MIDAYVHSLDRALRGPGRVKRDLLTEARHSLLDSAEGYRADGLSPTDAEQQAVTEFGSVPTLAAAYQAELSANALRTLSLRIFLVWILLASTADLMWQGAPWSGSAPTAGYLLLSEALNWAWGVSGLASIISVLWLTWQARRARSAPERLVRVLGRVLTGALVVNCLCAIAVYGWSLGQWRVAITWPPMLIGGAVMFAAYAWLATAARSCLVTTR